MIQESESSTDGKNGSGPSAPEKSDCGPNCLLPRMSSDSTYSYACSDEYGSFQPPAGCSPKLSKYTDHVTWALNEM